MNEYERRVYPNSDYHKIRWPPPELPVDYVDFEELIDKKFEKFLEEA